MKNAFVICMFLLISACAQDRHQIANDFVQEHLFQNSVIRAEPFLITSYNKIKSQNNLARIYIEGDGLAWSGRRTPSLDPTPIDPVALRLAMSDPAENIIYLARPCQYTKMISSNICPDKYWTSHRFAPEVVASYQSALDQLKEKYNLTGFELVGFSGGANIAVLLSAKRNDITNLRTVAGNLDHKTLHEIHDVSQLSGSLNAADYAMDVFDIPQMHFVGADDKLITIKIIESFKGKSGKTNCVHGRLIENASHEKGWTDIWPDLLNIPVKCNG